MDRVLAEKNSVRINFRIDNFDAFHIT
jgi:hypothetical protein